MKIKFILILGAVAMLFSSCEKWLDEVKPETGELNPDLMFASEIGVQNAMVGAYDLLKASYGGRSSCVGYMSFIQMYEFRGVDVNNTDETIGYPYGFANSFMINVGASATGAFETQFVWNLFYQFINNLNAIIKGVATSPLSDGLKEAYIAEATALRGWAYFQLSRSYQFSYNRVEKSALCVPVYTEPANSNSAGNPRWTMEKVYEQIFSDLSDDVISKINTVKPSGSDGVMKFRINQDVAYGFRAQIKLEMEDWSGAAADALKAIGDNASKYPLMTVEQYQSGFNTFNDEWMWGMQFRPDQAYNYNSFFAVTDYMQDGYMCFYPNSAYVDLLAATDMRRELMPLAKDLTLGTKFEIDPTPAAPLYYLTTKFLARGSQFDGDYLYMRASEMILIQAECHAQMGNSGQAQDLLYLIQKRADETAVKSINTGPSLVEEILLERRKELFGEVATSYYDLRRYNKRLTHVANTPYEADLDPYPGGNSFMWLLQIPQKEMDTNKSMEDQQNERPS